MIYVSSSCIRSSSIKDSIETLVQLGYLNIELSGGTRPYDELERDLLSLQDAHGINYLCHNYFPPPSKDFVLNVASLDEEISELSVNHVLNAIKLSQKLGADKFAFHAGFRINIPLAQIGKRIEKQALFELQPCIDRFKTNLSKIRNAFPDMDLYVENNVVSQVNFDSFESTNPFFLTNTSDLELISPFKPLVDVAHLKVSCNTLGLDLKEQLCHFFDLTDYVHVSDNNGFADQNMGIDPKGTLIDHLKTQNWKSKTVTLEVYSGSDDIQSSYNTISNLLGES